MLQSNKNIPWNPEGKRIWKLRCESVLKACEGWEGSRSTPEVIDPEVSENARWNLRAKVIALTELMVNNKNVEKIIDRTKNTSLPGPFGGLVKAFVLICQFADQIQLRDNDPLCDFYTNPNVDWVPIWIRVLNYLSDFSRGFVVLTVLDIYYEKCKITQNGHVFPNITRVIESIDPISYGTTLELTGHFENLLGNFKTLENEQQRRYIQEHLHKLVDHQSNEIPHSEPMDISKHHRIKLNVSSFFT